MAKQNLGKVACVPKGEYDNSVTYNKLDIVTYNGSSYIAIQETTTGNVPTNTYYWNLLAEKGDTGEKGDKGDKGDQGVQGIQGVQGPQGEAFNIYKTYSTIAEMNADKANVEEGKFVMIVSNVEDPDNAKLYVKGATDFVFLTDMSGATGIQGPKGEQGIQGIQGIQGEKGEKGDKGDTGEVSLVNAENMLNMGAKTISTQGNSYQDTTGITPVNPKEIETIDDIKIVGKNLYKSNESYSFTSNSTNWYFIDGRPNAYGSNVGAKTELKAPVELDQYYTISFNISGAVLTSGIVYEDETSIYGFGTSTGDLSYTFRSNRNGYVILRIRVEDGQTINISKIMLEKSSTATTYEQYKNVTIPLSTNELAKIGNISDKLNIDLDTGAVSKVSNIGKYVYNNDLTLNSQSENVFGFITPVLNIGGNLSASSLSSISLCNMMQTSVVDNSGLSGTTSASRIRVIISKSIVTTQEEAFQLFSTNNLTIYHVLKTPTTSEISTLSQSDIDIIKSIKANELNIVANLDTTLSSTTYLDTLIEYLRTQFQPIS